MNDIKMVAVIDEDGFARFKGEREDCFAWIMAQGELLSNGSRIFRTWSENGRTYFDVGRVYSISGD